MAAKKANTIAGLKGLLADTYTLYLKTQNYHWNVTGPQFHALHLFFENQYQALAEAVDQIAERLRALGERAPATFQEYLSLKTMPEGKENMDATAMLQDLYLSHEMLCTSLNKVLGQAKAEEDAASENFLADRLEKHEKMMWMLKAHL